MSVSNVHHRLILEDIGIIGSPQKMEEVSKWQHCVLQFHECIGITYWADDDYCFCYMIIYNFTKLKAVNTFLIDDEQKFGCSPELEVVRRNYIKNGIQFLLILKFCSKQKKNILGLRT